MNALVGQLSLGAVLLVVPVVTVTVCVALVAIAALGARRPDTRQHYLRILAALTRYVVALRSPR